MKKLAVAALVFIVFLAITGQHLWIVARPYAYATVEHLVFAPQVGIDNQDYLTVRNGFRTVLLREGPAPGPATEPIPPAGVTVVQYSSGDLQLLTWISRGGANDGHRSPAVLFLHGGHSLDPADWEMAKPYRDTGFIVMEPMLRGENGQSGHFSLLYDEVDDVVAAAEFLRRQPEVDPERLYVAGHSVGGTMAMLAAMMYPHFRAAVSLSGSPDQVLFIKYAPGAKGQVVFDPNNARELQVRSPLAYAGSFKCPARLYFGSDELQLVLTTERTAEIARRHGIDVQAVQDEGGHRSHVPASIQQSIEFFRQHDASQSQNYASRVLRHEAHLRPSSEFLPRGGQGQGMGSLASTRKITPKNIGRP